MSEFRQIRGISEAWIRSVPRYHDNRGFFSELFRKVNPPTQVPDFIQDSLSFSHKNVLRGMHIQIDQWQLVTLVKGEVVDILIDLRSHSPTYLESVSLNLSEDKDNQLLVAPGIVHGYGVLSDEAIIHYKSSVYYGHTSQFGLNWASPELKHHWPMSDWVVSERDLAFPLLDQLIRDITFIELIKKSGQIF